MLAQYTAASLVSENKVLAHPTSVDTIPTSGNQEDHVSMGWTSMRKLREVVRNVRTVLSVEILVACQALDFRAALASPVRPAPPCTTGSAATSRPWTSTATSPTRSSAVDAMLRDLVAAAEAAVGGLPATEPLAWFGGRLATELAEVTDDPAALDTGGWWAVVVTFEGRLTAPGSATCATAAAAAGDRGPV